MADNLKLNEALAANYALVDLRLRSWSGKRTDRGASDELIAQKHAVRDSGAFVKNLLASADAELKAVHTWGNAMRSLVYSRTLPWSSTSDDGAKRGERVIAAAKTMEFLVELAGVKREYDNSVLALAAVWPQRCASAIAALGGLGDPGDYPMAGDLPGMFSVSVDIRPIPAQSDFSRLNVPAELASALGQRAAEQAEVQVANAMAELQAKLVEGLDRLNTQLSKHGAGETTRLYKSLITNLQGTVDMARSMNLNSNPKLAELADKVEAKLLQAPIEAYKEDPFKALQIAAEAKALCAEALIPDVWQ